MPAIVRSNEQFALATFVECALSEDCFYGDLLRNDTLKKQLLLSITEYLYPIERLRLSNIPELLYQMLTLEKKAGPQFKKEKIRLFSQWLSK